MCGFAAVVVCVFVVDAGVGGGGGVQMSLFAVVVGCVVGFVVCVRCCTCSCLLLMLVVVV